MKTIEATPVGRDLGAETQLTHVVYGLLAACYFTAITALIAVVICDSSQNRPADQNNCQNRSNGDPLGIYRIAKGWLNLSEGKEMYR